MATQYIEVLDAREELWNARTEGLDDYLTGALQEKYLTVQATYMEALETGAFGPHKTEIVTQVDGTENCSICGNRNADYCEW